tara:strand:- start:626 stop:796 length:171 start_codon:yes stop_codon:yes gene_type:complete
MKEQEEWKIWPPYEIFYIESLLTKTKTAVDSSFIFPYKTTCFAGGHVLKAMPIFVL